MINRNKNFLFYHRPYFDAKEQAEYDLQVNFNAKKVDYSMICFGFQNQKLRIEAVQKAIIQAKKMYKTALNNLERISEEVRIMNVRSPFVLFAFLKIHMKRKTHIFHKLPPREPGVGSERPDEFIEMPKLGKFHYDMRRFD